MLFDFYFSQYLPGPHIIHQHIFLLEVSVFSCVIFYSNRVKLLGIIMALYFAFFALVYYSLLSFNNVEQISTYISLLIQAFLWILAAGITSWVWCRLSFCLLKIRYGAVLPSKEKSFKGNVMSYLDKNDYRPRTFYYILRSILFSFYFIGSDAIIDRTEFPLGLLKTYTLTITTVFVFYYIDRKTLLKTGLDEWSNPAEYDLAHFYWLASISVWFLVSNASNTCLRNLCYIFSGNLYANLIAIIFSTVILLLFSYLVKVLFTSSHVNTKNYKCPTSETLMINK